MFGIISFVVISAIYLANKINPIIITKMNKRQAEQYNMKTYEDGMDILRSIKTNNRISYYDGCWYDVITKEIVDDNKQKMLDQFINTPAKKAGMLGYVKRVITENDPLKHIVLDMIWFEINTNRPYVLIDEFSKRKEGKRFAKCYYINDVPKHLQTTKEGLIINVGDKEKQVLDLDTIIYMSKQEFDKWNISLKNINKMEGK